MVIQCSSCDTRFKLADDKLKPGGVKVRCSKCKEVFTVMPPEDDASVSDTPEETTSESTANDWSDLNGSADESNNEESGTDWSDMSSDDASDDSDLSSFSTNDDDSASDNFAFGDDDDADDSSEISFDDSDDSDNISFDDGDSGTDTDSISFDDSSDDSVSEDDFGFDEAVGEGAQDEFSFDDSGSSLDEPAGDDDTPDFDWDGSDDSSGSDDFDFGDAEGSDSGGDGGLDFSSVALEDEEETAPPAAMQEPEPTMMSDDADDKPLSAKGPQKQAGKARGRKQKKVKKKGPLRGLLLFILFIMILAGAHAGVLFWKGYWKGDPAELANLDHETVHLQVYQELYAELTGGKVVKGPEGEIAILNMNGRFVENNAIGTVFVIEGKVKNQFTDTRSAIAVRGVLFNQTGKPVMRKKVYCGNKLSEADLQTLPLAKINERLDNQFGDSLSNLDVAPGVVLPYTIVFGKLPDDLTEYNVEVAESTPGSQQ